MLPPGLEFTRWSRCSLYDLRASINLEGSVETGRNQELGVSSKSDSSGKGSVFAQDLKEQLYCIFDKTIPSRFFSVIRLNFYW